MINQPELEDAPNDPGFFGWAAVTHQVAHLFLADVIIPKRNRGVAWSPDGKYVSTGSGAYEQLIEPRHGDRVVNVVAEKLSHTGRTW